MKLFSHILAVICAVSLMMSGIALADPSVLTESGFPIVNEPVILKVMASATSIQPAFSEMTVLQRYAEMTGVEIEWISVPSSARGERVQLAIASGELPDVFLKCGISNDSLQVYGDNGDLLDLKPLLEQYAPNFWAYAQKYPDVLTSVSTPDGHICSLR